MLSKDVKPTEGQMKNLVLLVLLTFISINANANNEIVIEGSTLDTLEYWVLESE